MLWNISICNSPTVPALSFKLGRKSTSERFSTICKKKYYSKIIFSLCCLCLSIDRRGEKQIVDWLGSTVPYRTQSEPPPATFLKCLKAFLFSISKPPHGEWHNASEEWRERRAIRDRDSCELQPLFQKRGLIAMTEPPQPCAPATTTTPQSGHTISLCPHTHTHRCIEKLLTPRQQYVLYLCAQGGFSRKKNGCTRTVSSLLSCVLFLFIYFF